MNKNKVIIMIVVLSFIGGMAWFDYSFQRHLDNYDLQYRNANLAFYRA